MDINFELYKVFYYVAKNLSFSGASQELHISQSAVSQSVKLLEEKMNCRLFIRNTKQVKLTQEGETLFRHIEQAYNLIRAGERSIEEIHSLQQGEVRIGASDTICKYYLLPYLKKFNRLYPNIRIKVTNRTSPRCIELLKKGSVDVAVVNMPGTVEKTMRVDKVKTIHDVFIAGQNFAHLKRKKISLQELAQYPVLMLEKNTTTRNFIDTFLESKGVKIIPEVELGSVDLLVEMAKIGLGISLVVKEYIEKELSGSEVFMLNLREKIPARKLGVLTNNNIPLSVAAQKFVALLV
ncbi:transcriptional regulator, LysR family [Thermincola ferriacetica]|uniref:Transcriptional regulator, LysR family n=1 Tax=Thermincola ferriacetica TaxID=281456 RepID=A0A0L6W0J3_9FIRM|nr:LysR family transcriptional regulator [Thermincola ferriacetica]KNZ69050.1 transcriptional regulator, LysR family [Thermincola ferriacetica]